MFFSRAPEDDDIEMGLQQSENPWVYQRNCSRGVDKGDLFESYRIFRTALVDLVDRIPIYSQCKQFVIVHLEKLSSLDNLKAYCANLICKKLLSKHSPPLFVQICSVIVNAIVSEIVEDVLWRLWQIYHKSHKHSIDANTIPEQDVQFPLDIQSKPRKHISDGFRPNTLPARQNLAFFAKIELVASASRFISHLAQAFLVAAKKAISGVSLLPKIWYTALTCRPSFRKSQSIGKYVMDYIILPNSPLAIGKFAYAPIASYLKAFLFSFERLEASSLDSLIAFVSLIERYIYNHIHFKGSFGVYHSR